MADSFLTPRCSLKTLDTYIRRRAILSALNSVINRFSGRLLDVGCGRMPYRSLLLTRPSSVCMYVGLDLHDNTYDCVPDLLWDGNTIPAENATFDCALATEVLEHCPDPEPVLKEIYRILKPGGFFFLTVPFLWPLHDTPYDFYRYTPFALQRILARTGFTDLQLTPMGGWDASLAQLLGLWLRRRPMNRLLRATASVFLLPVVALLGNQTMGNVEGWEGMITGVCGSCTKPQGDNEPDRIC